MMSKQAVTVPDSVGHGTDKQRDLAPVAGLVLVFGVNQPQSLVLPLIDKQIELGREGPTGLPPDPKMSRRHATVSFDGQAFHVTDHGSQNGTFVEGARVERKISSPTARVLRAGDSLFLLCSDVRPFQTYGVSKNADLVQGPALQEVMQQAARAAEFGLLHISGESGSGKECVAHCFHAKSRGGSGPFVAVNCATIAPGVAERLLFGAKRGAYSGAVSDAKGLVQAADGGTLFLDEIGELDVAVQAKLLRALETRQVLPVGELRPQPVDIRLCSASHKDLRAEVASGRFREDLYFRISRPVARVPPLRQRLEEIPWLIQRGLHGVGPHLHVHSTFIEQCLLRAWPGNVRELLAEVGAAAQGALGRSLPRLEAQHLSPQAGLAIERLVETTPSCALLLPPGPPRPASATPSQAHVQEALLRASGNISAAARALGLHRTQLKRLIDKYGLGQARGEQSIEQDTE